MRRLILFALILSSSGCCSFTWSPREIRRAPPGATPPSLTGGIQARVLQISDFGETTCSRAAVVRAMVRENRRRPFDLGINVGDNLVPCGPDLHRHGARRCEFLSNDNEAEPGYVPPKDLTFAYDAERPLARLTRPDGAQVPMYVGLGNHDINAYGRCRATRLPEHQEERLRACLEVAHFSPQWEMPGRHYWVDQGNARFIFIDGTLLGFRKGTGYGDFRWEDELAFVREAARGCDGRYCFIVSHFPAASAGRHHRDVTDGYLQRVKDVEAAMGPHRIAGWLSGHAHDLIHVRAPAGYDVLIAASGTAESNEPVDGVYPEGAQLLLYSRIWGFAVLEVAENGWQYRVVDANDHPLYCCRAIGTGTCEPYRCEP